MHRKPGKLKIAGLTRLLKARIETWRAEEVLGGGQLKGWLFNDVSKLYEVSDAGVTAGNAYKPHPCGGHKETLMCPYCFFENSKQDAIDRHRGHRPACRQRDNSH
jgi:hypothetical protein